MNTCPRGYRLTIAVTYVVLMLAVAGLLWQARHWALDRLATPTARSEWQTWRDDVRHERDPQAATVARRVPSSEEPPALVLMRDHFPVCAAAAVVFTSVLYAVVVWMLRGVLSAGPTTSKAAAGPSG